MSGIYVIRNTVTTKVYVGSAKDFDKRCKQHFKSLELGRHSSIKLQRSYDKHGRAAFVFEIVEELPHEKSTFLEREAFWMERFDSHRNGYNIAPASFGDVLTHHPDRETIIERIKEGVIRRNATLSPEERRERWSLPGEQNPMYGRTHTPEARRKISEAHTGNTYRLGHKMGDEQRKMISEFAKTRVGEKNPFYGRQHTDDFKQRMAAKRRGIKPSNTLTVVIDGVEYQGLQDASKATGVNPITIRHRCLSENPKFAGYSYKDYIPPPKQTRNPRVGQQSPNKKPVSVDGTVYESTTKAAKILGISVKTVHNRVMSDKYPSYQLIPK